MLINLYKFFCILISTIFVVMIGIFFDMSIFPYWSIIFAYYYSSISFTLWPVIIGGLLVDLLSISPLLVNDIAALSCVLLLQSMQGMDFKYMAYAIKFCITQLLYCLVFSLLTLFIGFSMANIFFDFFISFILHFIMLAVFKLFYTIYGQSILKKSIHSTRF